MDPIPPSREPQICPLREMLDFPLRETQKGILIKGTAKINTINQEDFRPRFKLSVFHAVIELPIQQNAKRFLRQYLSLSSSISLSLALQKMKKFKYLPSPRAKLG